MIGVELPDDATLTGPFATSIEARERAERVHGAVLTTFAGWKPEVKCDGCGDVRNESCGTADCPVRWQIDDLKP